VHRWRSLRLMLAGLVLVPVLASGVAAAEPAATGPDFSAQPALLAAHAGGETGLDPLFDFVSIYVVASLAGTACIYLAASLGWIVPPEYYSWFVQLFILQHLIGTQRHDGVSEGFAQNAEFRSGPDVGEARITSRGYLAFYTDIPVDGLTMLDVEVTSGHLRTEDSNFESTTRLFSDVPIEPAQDCTSYHGETPVYDTSRGVPVETVTEEPVVTEEATSTSTSTTTTTQPATVIDTEEPAVTTTTREQTTGEACWWCWGVVALFLTFLLAILYIWLKSYDWWTCWLPWFIVIFAWVPFVLAGMWWWRPSWWWVPLLAWFPIIGGYTWYWAQKRLWWQPWYLYLVGGYLAALAIGMVVVGAPEWSLLFPLFWVPWVAFYLWFRGSRQQWWQPWMWGLAAAYVVWNFVWVINLTPWWAWWLPFADFGFIGWWFASHGYSWKVIAGPKWCWVIPFTFLPFLAWWIPLWGPWWCFVIIGFLAMTLFCAIFNHFKEEEWWSCWLPWFLVIWVGIPFLLMGLSFFQPNWWWLPLLAWFAVIPGYAYYWAQHRSWWLQWHWYVVGGYLAAAALLMVVVGSPTWGLLLGMFWLGPALFYPWYRPRRQPWFQPWMWGLFAAYAGFIFLWAINLSPYWGGWFPFLFFPFFGWWGMKHGYSQSLWMRKATALCPMALLPWMGYMIAIYCIPDYYM